MNFQPADRLFVELRGNLIDLWILNGLAVSGPDEQAGQLTIQWDVYLVLGWEPMPW
jgi:hypothetical protein